MKKPVKRMLQVVSILTGLLIIAALVLYINFRSSIKLMTPSDTGAINDSVWCIKDRFVNAYIFKGEQGYIILDAGIGAKNFRKELEKTGINPDQIRALFLTHTDGDHTGATRLFTNASIYMHKDEEQMINGTTGKTKFSKTKWKYGKYDLLASNDTLTIDGLKIKILHTPGHTPGSSWYRFGSDYLVTGDNLTIADGKYEHFIEMFNMNTTEQNESLKVLPPPDSFKYILTGHHGIVEVRR
jgi:hydroxyacylglutathione hydrolase